MSAIRTARTQNAMGPCAMSIELSVTRSVLNTCANNVANLVIRPLPVTGAERV